MDPVSWKQYLYSLLCLTVARPAYGQQTALLSPISPSQPSSAADFVAGLTPQQFEVMTPQQRLQLQQLMQLQQQQQLLQAQQLQLELQLQLQRQQLASLSSSFSSSSSSSLSSPHSSSSSSSSSTASESPYLVRFAGPTLNEAVSKPLPPFVLSGANTQQHVDPQDASYSKLPPQLSPSYSQLPPQLSPSYSQLPPQLSPFVPPPGAAEVSPAAREAEITPLLDPPTGSDGLSLQGSALVGGSPTGHSVPLSNEMLQQLLKGGFSPRSEMGFSPRSEMGFSPRSEGRLSARSEMGFSPRSEMGFSPRSEGNGPVLPRQAPRTSSRMVCPQADQGCSGSYFTCTHDSQCSQGSRCCNDACGRICKKATLVDAPWLPGVLLVAQCLNPNCGSPGFMFASQRPSHSECDAIQTCRAPHVCCFDGCRNLCRHPTSPHGLLGGASGGGPSDPMWMMMAAAAAAS